MTIVFAEQVQRGFWFDIMACCYSLTNVSMVEKKKCVLSRMYHTSKQKCCSLYRVTSDELNLSLLARV